MWGKQSQSLLSFLRSPWCSGTTALLAITLASINSLHCILQQSTHAQFYLQSSNGHHAAGKVWRECVLLATKSLLNPQTASEAKMDAPIRTASVKDGDKGFYITLRSCSKPTQKHTIHSEWTALLFPSWQHYVVGWGNLGQFHTPTDLKWTSIGPKILNPQKNDYIFKAIMLRWNYSSSYRIGGAVLNTISSQFEPASWFKTFLYGNCMFFQGLQFRPCRSDLSAEWLLIFVSDWPLAQGVTLPLTPTQLGLAPAFTQPLRNKWYR